MELYKKKYGSDYMEKYSEDHPEEYRSESDDREYANSIIYHGRRLFPTDVSGPNGPMIKVYERHMQEVYGSQYSRLKNHIGKSDEVTELLLQDAVRTGRWEELPECLQEECKMRMFGRRKK